MLRQGKEVGGGYRRTETGRHEFCSSFPRVTPITGPDAGGLCGLGELRSGHVQPLGGSGAPESLEALTSSLGATCSSGNRFS